VSCLRGRSHRTVARVASGTAATTEKQSQGWQRRPGTVEQAGGGNSRRRGVELRAWRSGASAAPSSYGCGRAGLR
jgi:hypothetical protein